MFMKIKNENYFFTAKFNENFAKNLIFFSKRAPFCQRRWIPYGIIE